MSDPVIIASHLSHEQRVFYCDLFRSICRLANGAGMNHGLVLLVKQNDTQRIETISSLAGKPLQSVVAAQLTSKQHGEN